MEFTGVSLDQQSSATQSTSLYNVWCHSFSCSLYSATWYIKLSNVCQILWSLCKDISAIKKNTTSTHREVLHQLISDWNLIFFDCVTDRDILLVSPVHPVTEGDSVSLSCKLRRKAFDSIVFFYRNDIQVIQNDSRRELNISAVSKSDEGFYKCEHSQQVSAQSWMSVKGEWD